MRGRMLLFGCCTGAVSQFLKFAGGEDGFRGRGFESLGACNPSAGSAVEEGGRAGIAVEITGYRPAEIQGAQGRSASHHLTSGLACDVPSGSSRHRKIENCPALTEYGAQPPCRTEAPGEQTHRLILDFPLQKRLRPIEMTAA